MIPAKHRKVKVVLDAVLKAGGGEFIANSEGEAIHVRQQCYRFRKWYRENRGVSSYDDLVIRQDREKLTFDLEPELPGKLTLPDGSLVDLTVPEAPDEEDVLLSPDEMAALIGDLGLEVE